MAGYTVIHRGHVSEVGKLVLADREGFLRSMHGYAGKDVEVVVRRVRAQRSSQANRYYRGVVIPMIADYCGYEHDQMHEAIAMMFLPVHSEVPGAPVTRRSTADLTSAEFTYYVDTVRRWAAVELGIDIPDPGRVEAV